MPQIVPAPELRAIPRLSTDRRDGQGKVRMPDKPDALWHYTLADGTSFGYVARWNETDIHAKVCFPLTYQTADGKFPEGWRWKGFSNPRPLLYLPEITASPMAPVLIVEGEKTADGARRYLPDGWLVTTWQGGTSNFQYSDWAFLTGHPIVIWPDNDDAGAVAGAKLLQHLQSIGIASSTVDLPRGLPDKYDLGDDLPDGLTADAIRTIILTAAGHCIADTPAAEPAPELPEDPRAGIDHEIMIVPLGYRDRKYFFLAKQSQTVLEFTGREIQDRKALMELCTDVKYWSRQYGSSTEGMDWSRVGSDLMEQCHRVGIYDPDNIRGRGCWIDKGRVVFHGGDKLLVDGVACEPIAIQSRFIYAKQPRFFDLSNTVSLTANEGKNLLKICKMFPWKQSDQLLSDLACGGIAAGPICGALNFRSNYWLTGPTSSGKSYFVKNFAGACAGKLSMRPEGRSTEAGIRQRLRSESVPVLFDEAESHGVDGEAKRQMIVQMMRMSTQDTGGELIMGSATHHSQSFRVQAQFMLASIGVGLTEAADLNRCLVLTLDNPTAQSVEEQDRRIANFKALQEAVAALPPDLPQKLLCRMLGHVNHVRSLADTLANHLVRKLGKSTIRRVGELLGTPLSAMWFLTHDAPPRSATAIDQWLSRYNLKPWEGGNEQIVADEGIGVLRYLADQEVRVEFTHGGGGMRTVGALLANLSGVEAEDKVPVQEAARVLNAIGLRYERMTNTVLMCTCSTNLDRLMRHAPYGSSYTQIIGRRDGVRKTDKPMYIGNKSNRPLIIPLDAILGDYKNAIRPEAFPLTGNAEMGDMYEPGQDG